MPKKTIDLNRTQKILLTLSDLSKGKRKDIRYEDIVVGLFKKYPKEFHLKGYPKYPDSGDGPQRLLYQEKENGNLTSGNKYFRLTEKGISYVKSLRNNMRGKMIKEKNRLSAYTEKEIKRITNLNAYNFFLKGDKEKILDTDFYNYLGVTVRADKSNFQGRIKALKDTMRVLENLKFKNASYVSIIEFHKFLFDKFKTELIFKLSN